MKKAIFLLTAIFLSLAISVTAQSKSNAAILKQIKQLRAEKTFTLTSEPGSNTSKLMAVSENFSDSEADRAGIRAMNFAIGFYYPGDELRTAPDPIMLTFWVLTKKPRFADDHSLRFTIKTESIDLEPARYISKPRNNMEYLNFRISREQLAKIANNSNVKISLGGKEFKLTDEQLRVLANLWLISDSAK